MMERQPPLQPARPGFVSQVVEVQVYRTMHRARGRGESPFHRLDCNGGVRGPDRGAAQAFKPKEREIHLQTSVASLANGHRLTSVWTGRGSGRSLDHCPTSSLFSSTGVCV